MAGPLNAKVIMAKCSSTNKEYTCPWCGDTGTVRFADSFDVKGGGF
jgi:hypothetical protein